MNTSKDRVLQAVNHIQPDVTPVHILGFEGIERWFERFNVTSEYDLREKLDLDVQTARSVYSGANAGRRLSIWGTKPDVLGYGGAGYSRTREDYPLAKAESSADIERFPWPDPTDFDCEIAARVLGSISNRARFIGPQYSIQSAGISKEDLAKGTGIFSAKRAGGGWLPILCTLFELMGLEETLVGFQTQPKVIEAAINRITEFVFEFTHKILEATNGVVEFCRFGDDFATQRGLMISPEQWRKFLKPAYKRLFGLASSP